MLTCKNVQENQVPRSVDMRAASFFGKNLPTILIKPLTLFLGLEFIIHASCMD